MNIWNNKKQKKVEVHPERERIIQAFISSETSALLQSYQGLLQDDSHHTRRISFTLASHQLQDSLQGFSFPHRASTLLLWPLLPPLKNVCRLTCLNWSWCHIVMSSVSHFVRVFFTSVLIDNFIVFVIFLIILKAHVEYHYYENKYLNKLQSLLNTILGYFYFTYYRKCYEEFTF